MHDCRADAGERTDGHVRVRNRQAYERAMAYVASRDRSWPYSFENVCETIGVDASYLRRGIERTLGVLVDRYGDPRDGAPEMLAAARAAGWRATLITLKC
jgi:hypothetical protein